MGLDEIVVLVPVYQRPHRVQPLIRSFEQSRPRKAYMLFIASSSDGEELEALQGTDHMVYPAPRGGGDWAKKINHGYRHTDQPWILCCADDVLFRKGWDTALRRAARLTGKRVLGTNDLNPHTNPEGIYSPHPLVARSYADERGVVDRPRQIVCEKYDHNYPDRELSATAIARNEWAFVEDAVIEHLHPGWTDATVDNTYRIGARYGQRDYHMYLRRHRLWERERRLRLVDPH